MAVNKKAQIPAVKEPVSLIWQDGIHSFVTGEPRDFIFGTLTYHSTSHPAEEKSSLKEAWSGSNNLMESHFFHGLGANLWRGTSPCQIPMPSPTYKTPQAVQEPQPIKRLPVSPPSIVILLVLTSSCQLPLKLPGHGTRWPLNWFKRLADGSHLSPRTAERQYFCSRACPLPSNEEMRSPSSARSLPPTNHPLQSFLA